nr:hypothetical protein [Gordonia bronchialis]
MTKWRTNDETRSARLSRHQVDRCARERDGTVAVLGDIVIETSECNVREDESRSGFDERVTGVAALREKPNLTPIKSQVWKPREIAVSEFVLRDSSDAAIHIPDVLTKAR